MGFKYCVILLLISIHGTVVADESPPASFSITGDHVVSRPAENATEVTISGNAQIQCDLHTDDSVKIKADRLVVNVPNTKPDAQAIPNFAAESNCQLTSDGVEIRSTRMVATTKSNGKSMRIKFSGDVSINFNNAKMSATTATLRHSRGKWIVEHLHLKRLGG